MRRVRRQHTAPELEVRRALHGAGLRYRLHVRVAGISCDIVLARRRTIVMVHGCFWHGHDCPHGAKRPQRNADYWTRKIDDNRLRDQRQLVALVRAGWQVEVVWECEAHDPAKAGALAARILCR